MCGRLLPLRSTEGRGIYKGPAGGAQTPIGVFLELEGPESWIDQTARRLGFGPGDYVTCSNAALYEEYRRSHATVPRDMKFHLP